MFLLFYNKHMSLLRLLKKPAFTIGQMSRLSNIFDNAGQVILGVVVLSPIISGFDKTNIIVVLSGMVVMIFCWSLSVWLARKGE